MKFSKTISLTLNISRRKLTLNEESEGCSARGLFVSPDDAKPKAFSSPPL